MKKTSLPFLAICLVLLPTATVRTQEPPKVRKPSSSGGKLLDLVGARDMVRAAEALREASQGFERFGKSLESVSNSVAEATVAVSENLAAMSRDFDPFGFKAAFSTIREQQRAIHELQAAIFELQQAEIGRLREERRKLKEAKNKAGPRRRDGKRSVKRKRSASGASGKNKSTRRSRRAGRRARAGGAGAVRGPVVGSTDGTGGHPSPRPDRSPPREKSTSTPMGASSPP